MYAGKSNKTLAQLKESNFSAGLVIQEIMETKPGRQDDYIRELERLYVPWSERTTRPVCSSGKRPAPASASAIPSPISSLTTRASR